MHKTKWILMMVTVAFILNSPCDSNATNININTSYWAQEGIGNTFGGTYDVLIYSGIDIALDLVPGQAVTAQIGQVEFKVGNTGSGSVGSSPTGTIVTNINANGVLGTINLPWTVTIGSTLDSIEVGVSDTITLDLGLNSFLHVALSGWGSPSYVCGTCIVIRPIYASFLLNENPGQTNQTCIQWTEVAGLQAPKKALGAAALNGKIYAFGGHRYAYLDEAEVYDPNTDNWQWIGSLNHSRTYPGAVAYDNRIWGINGGCCGIPTLDSIEVYCADENQWYYSNNENKPCYDKVVPFLGVPQENMNRVVTLENKIYVVGGQGGKRGDPTDHYLTFSVWDGLKWDHLAPLPMMAYMPAVTAARDEIFMIGGLWEYPDGSPYLINQTFIYNPVTNNWREGPPINIARAGHTAVTVGNKIFVIGGSVSYNPHTLTDSVEILDLSSPNPTWQISECSKLSFPRDWHASVVLNNEIYVIGGYFDPYENPISHVFKGTLANQCPIANAGEDLIISYDGQNSAVIQGIATDPDYDCLTYKWFEGSTKLVSGQVVDGKAPLDLSTLPKFSPGAHTLKLEVTDGRCTSSDEIILRVEDKDEIQNLGPAIFWIGLKNSDDQGTQFDLKAELHINGKVVADGKTLCVTGVTRNPSYAKQVLVPFGPVSNGVYNPGDVLSLKVFTRVGTTADGQKCSGPGGSHNNAVGLRLYYDGATRGSAFGAKIAPDPLTSYFLHSSGSNYFLDDLTPTGSEKYKDSGSVNYNNGNPWKEIGTWSMTLD